MQYISYFSHFWYQSLCTLWHSAILYLQGKGPAEEGLPSWRRKVCYVSDSPPPLLVSAEEAFLQVLSFSSRSTVPSNSASQLAYFREVAEQLGVSPSALQRPFTVLSAGERQRVSLSWAVALHPLVLLLDEPTSHLDSEAVTRFELLIKQVGCTVVCLHLPSCFGLCLAVQNSV